MEEQKRCISCGMPMKVDEDYPQGDTTKEYCAHCARPDGSMKSWEEAVIHYRQYLQEHENMGLDEARVTAIQRLSKNPAWRDRG